MDTTHDIAERYVARLNRNVADFYGDRVTYDEFSRRQRAAWDAIATDVTLHHNVLALLRGDRSDLLAAEVEA